MHNKTEWKPGNMIFPLPAVMVSCGKTPDLNNILTIAWTGTTCSNPPMCYISVRRERHSYQLIKDAGGFVINLTTKDLCRATDWCGVKSGRDFNKFKEMNLTAIPAKHIDAPMILESPVNIECRVTEIIPLGSHDMFHAEVVCVHADDKYIDPKSGRFLLEEASPISYLHGHYYEIGKQIGKFGFSVMKKSTKKRLASNKKNQ